VVAGPAVSPAAKAAAQPAVRVSQQVADGLFAALGGGAVNAAELALGNIAQGLAAQLDAAGSAQAKLDSLIWESDASSWQSDRPDRLI
jgi:hypothetical protein